MLREAEVFTLSGLSVHFDRNTHSKQGEKFLDKYVQDNSSKILNDRIAKLEKDAEEERAKLEARRNKYKEEHDSEIARLSAELEKLRVKERNDRQEIDEQLAEYRQQSEKQKKEEIQKQNAELMAEIEVLEKQRDAITSENAELGQELEHLRQARSLQSIIENLEFQKDSLVRTIETKDALLSDTNELRKLAIQDKTLKQLMSLNSTIDSDQKIEFSEVVCNENPATRPEDYIESIKSHLDEQDGRSLSRDEVANLMICVSQNYLTCLAGLPGGGKTSSVVRLAEAMGLHNPEENKLCNFLNVSVGQGWAGLRDLLGYFNAIKGEFQPAPTKLYEFLQHLQDDQEKKFLRLVLLDEGNLSPLEHYWSDFLQMADVEYRNKVLSLGAKDNNLTLQPGNNLRWITTINSDETTERLSPRLLDRVPVIKMDPELDIESTLDYTISEAQTVPGGVDWTTLESWFSPQEDKDFSVSDRQIIKFILDLNDKSRMLHLSQRKLRNMRNYLSVANQHMGEGQALDWCIAMYVLPTIEGYGKRIEEGLQALIGELDKNGLRRSFKIVDSILEEGRMSQSYSFF